MIEDFDGPDPPPSHRGHIFAVSVLLMVGVVVGYGAVSSPELRGPFATPRPSAAFDLPTTSAQVFIQAPPTLYITTDVPAGAADCLRIVLPHETNVFVAGRPITVVRPVPDPPPGVETGVVIGPNGATGVMWNTCDDRVIWGQPPSPMPYYRVSP